MSRLWPRGLDRNRPAVRRTGRQQKWRVETVRRVPDVDLEAAPRCAALRRDDAEAEAATTVDGPDALDLRD